MTRANCNRYQAQSTNNHRAKTVVEMLTKSFSNTHKFICVCLLSLSLSSNASSLEINGQAIHSEFQMDYYLAQLYSEETSQSIETLTSQAGSQKMSLTILADSWSKRRFSQLWNQSILINNSASERKTYAKEIAAFKNMLKGNLVKGDKIDIVKSANKGMKVSLNDTILMTAKDSKAFLLFLNSWIGPRPPSSGFKASILGTEILPEEKIASYGILKPSDKRKKEIAAWMKPKKAPAKVLAVVKEKPKPARKQKVSTLSKAKTKTVVTKTTKIQTQAPVKKVFASVTKPVAAKKIKPETAKAIQPISSSPTTTNKAITNTASIKSTTATNSSVEATTFKKPAANSNNQATVTNSTAPKTVTKRQLATTKPLPSSVNTTSTKQSKTVATNITEQVKATPKVEKPETTEDKLLKVYRSNVLTLTYQNVIYPSNAIDRGHEGKVILKLTINRKGKVKKIDFTEKSKYSSLNKAAAKAVSNASPFPSIPRKLNGKEIEILLPIKFSLSG